MGTPPPIQTHLGKATDWGAAGASEGHQDFGAAVVTEWAQKCSHQPRLARQSWAACFCSPWAALVPARANPSLQPRVLPATRSRGHRSGLCHPPLGGESSLVPTVEQKAASPWAGSPHPISPCPSPTPPPPMPGQLGRLPLAASPSHQALLVCIFPPNNTQPRGPALRGCEGNSTPALTKICYRESPALRRSPAACTRPHPPTDLEVKAQGTWGEEGVGG